MKKLLITCIALLLAGGIAYAADQNLTAKTADTSPTSDDIIYVVDDPGGTAADRKVTLANLAANMPAIVTATVNTGQGANELYDMDQNVLTSSDVTFNSIIATDMEVANDMTVGTAQGLVNGYGQMSRTIESPLAGKIYPVGLVTSNYAPNGLSVSGNLVVTRSGDVGEALTESGTIIVSLLYSDLDASNEVTISSVTLTDTETNDSAAPTTQDVPINKRMYIKVTADTTKKYTLNQPYLKKVA